MIPREGVPRGHPSTLKTPFATRLDKIREIRHDYIPRPTTLGLSASFFFLFLPSSPSGARVNSEKFCIPFVPSFLSFFFLSESEAARQKFS